MRTAKSLLSASLVIALGVLVASPVAAQTKAQLSKTAFEFQTHANALTNNLAGLSKRVTTASPNDKEMLRLVMSQAGIVDATAGGVLILGLLGGEMKDASDLAAVKKHLVTGCATLKASAASTGDYVGSLANNIAAPATAAEVRQTKELLSQLAQHALCNPK
jgi:hypothetical protein